MLSKINPTTTNTWKKLESHKKAIENDHMRDYFEKDKKRANKFTIEFDDIILDYSKNRITENTMELLIELANEINLKNAIESMFKGDHINETEDRAVLHTALRNVTNTPIIYNNEDIMIKINQVLQQMKSFTEKIHNGSWKGYSGKKIKSIVNIGIGGSDLGPVMVTEALKHYAVEDISVYFVSNIDGTHIAETLKKINPETTIFLIASKTFTTQETMTNANTAKKWFLSHSENFDDIAKHFVAISTNTKKVIEFGISEENIFRFWDWVGGRYSLWSAIGLSIACYIGFENFHELLSGANEMDLHFKESKFRENIPVILGLLGIWYNNFFDSQSYAILPYEQYLHRFAAYLQQGDMESNGKRIDRNGQIVEYQTGPIIWGEPGTNGQHAFYQLIHQGTKLIPSDFIGAMSSLNDMDDHHDKLMSNFFAQTEALMKGKDEKEALKELKMTDLSNDKIKEILPHKIFPGNIPTNSILYKKLTPNLLGKLIAMYEHKIFVQGIIWNIFSYDQWGVELGKQLAKKIQKDFISSETIESHDCSTNYLINTYKKNKN